jgi:hypothetical protein
MTDEIIYATSMHISGFLVYLTKVKPEVNTVHRQLVLIANFLSS